MPTSPLLSLPLPSPPTHATHNQATGTILLALANRVLNVYSPETLDVLYSRKLAEKYALLSSPLPLFLSLTSGILMEKIVYTHWYHHQQATQRFQPETIQSTYSTRH